MTVYSHLQVFTLSMCRETNIFQINTCLNVCGGQMCHSS